MSRPPVIVAQSTRSACVLCHGDGLVAVRLVHEIFAKPTPCPHHVLQIPIVALPVRRDVPRGETR